MSLKSIFSKVKSHHGPGRLPKIQDSFPRRLVNDPYLGWQIALIISAISAIVLVSVGVSVYLGTSARLRSTAGLIPSPPPPFNASLLTQILNDFNTKAAITADGAVHSPIPPDPSLP